MKSASSWLLARICKGMHGQQYIKFIKLILHIADKLQSTAASKHNTLLTVAIV